MASCGEVRIARYFWVNPEKNTVRETNEKSSDLLCLERDTYPTINTLLLKGGISALLCSSWFYFPPSESRIVTFARDSIVTLSGVYAVKALYRLSLLSKRTERVNEYIKSVQEAEKTFERNQLHLDLYFNTLKELEDSKRELETCRKQLQEIKRITSS